MKILVFRFSSFGDVLQTLSVAGRLRQAFPQAQIHWVTRDDFKGLIENHPAVNKLWLIRKEQGFSDLLALARVLKAEGFTHIYDAHNNLRSRFICAYLNGFLGWRRVLKHRFLRRSIFRGKRFLLFRMRINLFEKPFSGQRDLLKPLEKWGVKFQLPPVPQLFSAPEARARVGDLLRDVPDAFVALAPSAAFELKRWPLEYFKKLIASLPEQTFVVLGGREDAFLEALVLPNSRRVLNLAGRLSLAESVAVVERSRLLIANDTGLMHVAEQFGVPCIALMGPAPFGFPSRPRTRVLELDLPCRPCSKHGQGPCRNVEFQKCLRGIPPERVKAEAVRVLNA